uniref:C-type lectin domain-containing protein n=1 Tax=Pygocentrus nattereri TaxID=42514 RepID=A0A3B4BZN7_PYGNA
MIQSYWKFTNAEITLSTWDEFSLIHSSSGDGQNLYDPLFQLNSVCGVSAYVPHRYHFVNENKTWTEAQTQSYCRQNYADLVSINNMEEMKKLNATLKDTPRSLVWIGLEKGNTRKWQWSLAEGNVPSERDAYRNWSLGEPNNSGGKEFCVAMKKTVGTWLDDDCNTLRKFMCYDGETNLFLLLFNYCCCYSLYLRRH